MNNLKKLRESKKLTQEDVAKIVFTTNQSISNWENERFEPDVKQLKILADFFNVSIDYLLGREEKEVITISKDKITNLTSEQKTKIILRILEIIEKE